MNKNSYLILIVILFTLLSCKKYLDKKSNTSLVVPTTISDLQALLDNSTLMNLGKTPIFEENSADDYFIVDDYYNNFPIQDQKAYTWIPNDNVIFPNDWSYPYSAVYPANYCLEMIEKIGKVTSNEATWNNIKGSALFYRAYYFCHLAWTFAKAYDVTSATKDPGIVLRLTSDFNAASKRATVQETYNQIITDAKESVAFLPDNPSHCLRPSKAAAYGLLARVYLSMREYDSALKYSNLCLQIKNTLIDYNGDNDIINPFNTSGTPFKQFNKETIFFTDISNSYGGANPYYSDIDTSLLSTYDNNDLRRAAYFTDDQSYPPYQLFKGSYSANTSFTGIATDEMYLTRAECYARKGDKASALNDLNTLLSKRYDISFAPVTTADANGALIKILLERRKELVFRDLRFIDIKRLNKEGTNIIQKRIVNGQTYTIMPNDPRYALPIPKDIINQAGIQQNSY